MSNSMRNSRKVALITGANKGIGFEITRQLGRAGMTVLLSARNPSQGEASAIVLRGEGLDVHPKPLDLLNEETISSAAEWIASQYGRLDVLVNNAGIVDGDDGPPSSADLDAVRRVFDVNFWHPGCHESHVAVDPEGARRKDRKFVERLGIARAEQRPHLVVRFIQGPRLLRFQGSPKHDDSAARI